MEAFQSLNYFSVKIPTSNNMREKSTIPQYMLEDSLTISRQPVAFSRTIFSFSVTLNIFILEQKGISCNMPWSYLCPSKTHLSLIINIALNYKKSIDEVIIDANVFS